MKTSTLLAVAGLVAGTMMTTSGCDCGGPAAGPDTGTPTDTTDDTNDDGETDDGLRSCVRDSDCPAPQVCHEVAADRGVCGPECREDFDCCTPPSEPCGLVCREELCVAGDPETCDGLDNDADGEIDEDFTLDTDPDNCGRCGLQCDVVLAHAGPGGTTCADGVCQLIDDGCTEGFHDINGSDADGCEYACHTTNGGVEESDGDDNNCDGAVDEGFACTFGRTEPCGAGTGICQEGAQQCQVVGTWSDCENALGAVLEVCNGLDDDCNGEADDGIAVTAEVCDTGFTDEDCDGLRNEGCDCTDGAERSCGLTDP
ncbi:MAG: hypothetical protein Q7S02_04690, partial [bacterium]|nr:hypothetical protein [bacterium]